MVKKLKFEEIKPEPKRLRLDLGAGKGLNTPEGFTPVDVNPWEGVTVVDLRKRWPWKANSVDEARCIYVTHYLTAGERVHFFNELFRVLKPGAKALLHTPHWCSSRAYIDPRVQWPPVSEASYWSLNKAWREGQNEVDTTGLVCDFEPSLGYGMHHAIVVRNQEFQQDAVQWYKEAAQDLIATVTKPE